MQTSRASSAQRRPQAVASSVAFRQHVGNLISHSPISLAFGFGRYGSLRRYVGAEAIVEPVSGKSASWRNVVVVVFVELSLLSICGIGTKGINGLCVFSTSSSLPPSIFDW